MSTIYNFLQKDNLDVMPIYPNGYFELACVDPEYGIGESSRDHKSRNTAVIQRSGNKVTAKPRNYIAKDWDKEPPPAEYFRELFRISISQIIFGANYFIEIVGAAFKPPRRAEYQKFISEHPRGWIIWDKVNGDNDFNDCELIWTSFDFPSYVYYFMWSGMMQGKSMLNGTVQEGNKRFNEIRIHPTQKPVNVYLYLYSRFAKLGTNMVDTHLGSRSSAIAARMYGITEFVGIEKDEDIFSDGQKRWDKFKLKYETQFKLEL